MQFLVKSNLKIDYKHFLRNARLMYDFVTYADVGCRYNICNVSSNFFQIIHYEKIQGISKFTSFVYFP